MTFSYDTPSLLSLSDSGSVTAKRSRSGRILKTRIFPTSFQNPVISDMPIECDECQFLVHQGMLEEYRNHHRTAHFEAQQISCDVSVNHELAAITPGIAAGKQRVALRRGPADAGHSRSFLLDYPPKCSVCHRLRHTSRGVYHYLRHYRSVHLKIKEYSCGICGKEFSESGNLDKHHRAIHLKIKSFSCEICGRKFSQKQDVKKHSNRNNGCKPQKDTSDQEEEDEDASPKNNYE